MKKTFVAALGLSIAYLAESNGIIIQSKDYTQGNIVAQKKGGNLRKREE